MTTKAEVIDLHQQHPDWTAPMMAKYLGCTSSYIRATARREGFTLAKAINSDGGGVRELKAENAALRAQLADARKKAEKKYGFHSNHGKRQSRPEPVATARAALPGKGGAE